ncbi:MAG: hypothetical protein OEZ34_04575 [Spirochaetia bacterium]|nr:hypothetical protein [Spirochaetia bacterium]
MNFFRIKMEHSLLPVFLSGFLLSGPVFAERPETCLLKLNITRNQSIFWNQVHYDREKYQYVFSIVKRFPLNYKVFPGLAKYSFRSRPWAVLDPKKEALLFNGNIFKKLYRISVHDLPSGETKKAGMLSRAALKNIPLRNIILFLIESEMIETYIHVESKLCLAREENGNDFYRAYFTGKHYYYTNEENIVPVSFSVSIHKKTGEISAAGGP